ncbi:ribosomal protection-like ABC-F family protein [Priestia megaterium]|uniref:ribosomal protection-like ABC-F family protein n=1 Tax=Priestia megaterium TaxID=1404 RepID=UPI000CA3E1FA|nr:ABC-F type ribosomal protection protein [Priestia megaterium]AUO14629.1 ABC-F type ribosomal protection protein [Priestia megaterium]
MIISRIHQINKMFGGNLLFENLSLEIHERDRIGLVGRNGSGKSTIMKMLANQESVDSGVVSWRKGTKIGYLSQIPQFPPHSSSRDVLLSAFADILNISQKMKVLEKDMAIETEEKRLNYLLEEYGLLQENFLMSEGYEVDSKLSRVAAGLGITDLLDSSFLDLSGGEQTKVCLGMILLENPDLLLLDEPTNHLDVEAVEWLEQFLKDYNGTIVIVSHDRYFLDEVITKVIDLEDGEVKLYHQNYSGFVVEKEKLLMEEFQAYQEQQKKIKKMKEAIKRLREWANQASPPSESLFKRARNMERALERIEKLKRPILERKKMDLQFDFNDRSGKDVIVMKNVSKTYGKDVLFREANIHIQYKQRVAIVGGNGTGKSTLLKIIKGDVERDAGEIRIGSNVKLGYLSQHLYSDDNTNSVLSTFLEEVNVTEGAARNILARFLFYGPSVFRKVSQLSGGERMRLRLAQLMYQDINLLILDEPTNHLDIDSREALEEALEDFKGTILAVSHDRYLLNKLFNKTYWIDNKVINEFSGNYDWAKQKKQILNDSEQIIPTVVPSKKEFKEKETIDLEEIQIELEKIENSLLEINKELTIEKDSMKLQNLLNEQTLLERKQGHLYHNLDKALS